MIPHPLAASPQNGAPARDGKFELMGSRTTALHQACGRLVLIHIFFTVAYLALVIRAFDLMVLQGVLEGFYDQGDKIAVATAPAPNENAVAISRRDIVDRNGVLLATSIKTASLYADPHDILDPKGTAQTLSKIFPDQKAADLEKKLASTKRFVWIKRNITPDEQRAVLELGQPGLVFEDDYRRLYPQGPLAAHVIGYSGIDAQGLSGLEQGLDTDLKKKGAPISLTIDMRMQHILRREIQKTITDFTAVGGAGLIMDIQNGDVLALVSLPDFDPHSPGTASTDQKFNRATLGTYELGSTFKIFTTAALLEQLHPPMSTTFDTRNPIRVGRFTISDYHPENRPQTIPEVFMHSSNIGTAMMAQKIGTQGLKNFFDDLGLFAPPSFDLPEVGTPQVPHPWREISTLTASYGHGIAVTPLHMAAATATLIGDGRMVFPHLIRHENTAIEKGDRIVSKETVQNLRSLMRLVVRDGTGSKAEIPGLLLGGKTGTAEKNVNGRYIQNALISSFVGAFPMNDPRYLIFVTVDSPHPNKSSYGFATAGWTAAPAVARVAENMVRVMGIVPDYAAADPADRLNTYLASYHEKSAAPSASKAVKDDDEPPATAPAATDEPSPTPQTQALATPISLPH